MSVEIKEGRYFVAFVHAEFRAEDSDGNFSGCLYRDEDDPTELHFNFRLRFYVDHIHDITSKDRKARYEGTVPRLPGESCKQHEERAIEGYKVIAETVLADADIVSRDVLRIGSNDPIAVMRALETATWANIQLLQPGGDA